MDWSTATQGGCHTSGWSPPLALHGSENLPEGREHAAPRVVNSFHSCMTRVARADEGQCPPKTPSVGQPGKHILHFHPRPRSSYVLPRKPFVPSVAPSVPQVGDGGKFLPLHGDSLNRCCQDSEQKTASANQKPPQTLNTSGSKPRRL
jgi:hypothetical protein